jgi:hypothetical protein
MLCAWEDTLALYDSDARSAFLAEAVRYTGRCLRLLDSYIYIDFETHIPNYVLWVFRIVSSSFIIWCVATRGGSGSRITECLPSVLLLKREISFLGTIMS